MDRKRQFPVLASITVVSFFVALATSFYSYFVLGLSSITFSQSPVIFLTLVGSLIGITIGGGYLLLVFLAGISMFLNRR